MCKYFGIFFILLRNFDVFCCEVLYAFCPKCPKMLQKILLSVDTTQADRDYDKKPA